MKQTIEDLWYGNIAPVERCGVGDPEIKELIHLIERNKTALSDSLNDLQRHTFEKLLDCVEEYQDLVSSHAFCDGFSLAGRLFAEALQ